MKKLIYFTIGNNMDYIRLFELCVDSLEKVGYDGDILVITNFEKEIERIDKKNIYIQKVECNSMFDSSSNKLRLKSWESSYYYDKIIYCDVDFLWINNPDIIFNEIEEGFLYFCNEEVGFIGQEWGGEKILTEEEKYLSSSNKNMIVNAGFFGFSCDMINYVDDIREFMECNMDLCDHTLEQAFVNAYVFRNGQYKTTFNNLITKQESYIIDGTVAVHFAGLPGNFGTKYQRMINFKEKHEDVWK